MRALLLAAVMAGMAWGAAPRAEFASGHRKLIAQRAGLWDAGLKAWQDGRRQEAVGLMRQALAIELMAFGPWHGNVEALASRLADHHHALGEWAAEARFRRAAVEATARLYGEGDWRTTDARLMLAEALAQPWRTPAQRDTLNKALEANDRGMTLLEESKAVLAVPLLRQALALRKGVLGERHRHHADSLNNLAGALQATGDHMAALPLFRRALNLRRELLGERHPDHATSLNNLGLLLKDMGDHDAALPLFRRANALVREMLGGRHPRYADTLTNLASLLAEMGDFKAALRMHLRALALRRELFGERHPLHAASLHHVADLRQAMGDHQAALPLLRHVLALRKETLGVRHPSYAAALNNLAALHVEMGDPASALPLFRQAQAAFKEARGERHPDHATTLQNLSAVHHSLGDTREALALCRRALAMRKEVLGERHPHYAISLNNLARLHHAAGDFEEALSLCAKGLALRKKALGEKHPQYATGLANLAFQLSAAGDLAKALPMYERALALRKEVLGARHPDYASSLNSLAALHARIGNHDAALPLSEESLAVASALLRANAAWQSDRQQLAAAAALRHHLDVRLSIDDGPKHAPASAHALAWKGALLVRQRQRRLFLRLAADADARDAAERLQAATRRLAAARREKRDALVKEQEEAQARLSLLSADFRAEREKERQPDGLATILPEGVALADFHFYWRLVSEEGKPRRQRWLLAFVHRRGQPAARIDLGPAAPTEQAVIRWRPLLVKGKPDAEAGAALKKLVWSPLEKHLAGEKVVLVSPDGILGMVPFAALPGKGKGSYLIEDVALAIVPAPSAIPEMLRPVAKGSRLKPSLLVAGDLRYEPEEAALAAGEDTRAAPSAGRARFGLLPATRAEMLAVESSFKELFKGGAVTSLKKGEATRSAVREALSSVRYAHLATHGYFAPEKVKSALAHDGKDGPAEGRPLGGWHPLLLSGLALSGANRVPKEGEEDGILTALEVSEMDLTRLELAVLSACETGLGKVAGGEGVLGMQRAFQAAGTRSVIASLWKVDDRATMQLMSDFYATAWDPKKIVSRAEALRQAQLSMLREGRRRGVGKEAEKIEGKGGRLPPYYWAAFVLSGDWR